ncbi:MAG: Rrf2 family transcriptional regulator [Clostridia bacterium]
MRISVKGRYGMAAMISMAENYNNGEYITVISISEKLGISKIYLEQVFSLLKRGGLVNSVKGAQGGYQLTRMPQQITAYEMLAAIELSLFESTEETVKSKAPEIEKAMQLAAFDVLDQAVEQTLQKITLSDLLNEAEKHKNDQAFMFYI